MLTKSGEVGVKGRAVATELFCQQTLCKTSNLHCQQLSASVMTTFNTDLNLWHKPLSNIKVLKFTMDSLSEPIHSR